MSLPATACNTLNTCDSLNVGGITPLTSIDYPGELAAVVFCQGCPYHCGYCHNPELIDARQAGDFAWQDILEQLSRRRGLLDAVVFSGGEPTLQKQLVSAVHDVKRLGFKVALHTAGSYPQRLQALLPELDWVGLDIKTLAEDYPALTGVPGSGKSCWQSLELLRHGNTDYEVRITVEPGLLPENRLLRLLERLAPLQLPALALQQCQPVNPLVNPGAIPVAKPVAGHDHDNTSAWLTPKVMDFARQHFPRLTIRGQEFSGGPGQSSH